MICTCATHCPNTCEPAHCYPSQRCDCWCHKPKEVDLEGHIDAHGIEYIGIATLQPNGRYHVLAKVEDKLCRVECSIDVKSTPPPTPEDPSAAPAVTNEARHALYGVRRTAY